MDEDEAIQFAEDLLQGLQNLSQNAEVYRSAPERRNKTAGKVIDIHRWVTGGLDDER